MSKPTLTKPFHIPSSDGTFLYDSARIVKGQVLSDTKLPSSFRGSHQVMDICYLAEYVIKANRENGLGYVWTINDARADEVVIKVEHKEWPSFLMFTMPAFRYKRDIANMTLGVIIDCDRIIQVPHKGWGGALGFAEALADWKYERLGPADACQKAIDAHEARKAAGTAAV